MKNLKLERIGGGKMKIVEARVLISVPSYISLDSVRENVKEGVSFIIEEHLFRNLDVAEGEDNIVDSINGIDLLKVSCENCTKGISDD